ncbi:MAG: serine/threonine-protein kinase [Planctomycetota bacterium]
MTKNERQLGAAIREAQASLVADVSPAFLAERLRFYFGMCAVLAFAAGIAFLAFGFNDGRDWVQRVLDTELTLTPWSTAWLMGLGWALTRWLALSRPLLLGLDAVLSLALTANVALNAVLGRGIANGLLVVLFMMMTQLFRAVAIPSSGYRTGLIAGCAGVIAFCSVWREELVWRSVGIFSREPVLPLVSFGAWIVSAVAIAVTASHVIYGLRREIDRARKLGQYTLIEKIGRGGMGQVFRARHAMLRRPTAVKILTRADGDEEALSRFEREVQATSMLTHPNTIAIYDFGRTPEGIFYYAMEHLDGANLQEVVERSDVFCEARVLHVLEGVAASLAEAHASGLVHRDVKPANIFLCHQGGRDDVVKVLDFGLVKDQRSENAPLRPAGMILGTPEYLAPEAIMNPSGVDYRVDLYALGGVAYFLLTGRAPVVAETISEALRMQIEVEPPPIEDLREGAIDPELVELIEDLLAKEPSRRPKTANELLDLLEPLMQRLTWSGRAATEWWDEWGIKVRRKRPDPLLPNSPGASGFQTLEIDPTELQATSRRPFSS